MSEEKTIRELVSEAVDRGATTAEEIHRSIAELPLSVLEQVGALEDSVKEVRKVQDHTIGAIYDLIRDINQRVSQLAAEVLEDRGEDEDDA
jgi:hypothetical protein